MSRDSRELAEDTSILGRKAESEDLRNITSKLSEERNLRDFLKHYHMSTAQFKKRTTHLDIPRNFMTLPTRDENMPILQFRKTETKKISRERTWMGPWIGKDWRQNPRISDNFGWSHITSDKLSVQKFFFIGSNCQNSRVDGHVPGEP